MTWHAAKEFCQSLGNSRLVEIDSKTENDAISAEMQKLQRLTGRMRPDRNSANNTETRNSVNNTVETRRDKSQCTDFWMGLSDRRVEGRFVLESNGRSPSFTAWAGGEPNNAGGQDCALRGRAWDDFKCDRSSNDWCQISAICEKYT